MAKKAKKRSIVYLIALVLLVISGAAAISHYTSTKSPLLAKVNGEKITEKQLDHEYGLFFFISGYPEQYKEIITKEAFLNQSIAQLLLYNEAKNQGVILSPEETKDELESSFGESTIPREAFMKRLAENDFTYDDVINYAQIQLSVMRFMDEILFSILEVTDAEAEQYYETNLDDFYYPEQARAAHILVESKEEADSLVEEIGKGANFTSLAIEKSLDPTAKLNGGDLGFFGRGEMVEEFEYVSFALPPGKITIAKTQFGYHVVKVLDKRDSGTAKFEDVKTQIQDKLLLEKQRKIVEDSVELLKKNADITYY